MSELTQLGWSPWFAARLAAHNRDAASSLDTTPRIPARVAVVYQDRLRLFGERGPLWAELSGLLRHHAEQDATARALARPATGDWVALEPNAGGGMATVHAVLERRTRLVRQASGRRAGPQLLAANVDRIFVVTSPNQEFNARRVERYLAAVRGGGAAPVLLLNKTDLVDDPAPHLERLRQVADDAPVLAISAGTRRGASAFRGLLGARDTVAFVGSSGVGKSTIINWLLGQDKQTVGEIRERDAKGRHTTTHRELIVLPARALTDASGGPEVEVAGVLIDTPGIRELQLWTEGDAPALDMRDTFVDIEQIARRCRFRDCTHTREPGCAVRAAVKRGALPAERVASFTKLQGEARDLRARTRGESRRAQTPGRPERHSARR